MRVEIFADVSCPWSYIGKRRFERALQGFAHRDRIEIEWKSFELAPEMPPTLGLTHAQYLSSIKGIPEADALAMEASVTRIAAADGIDLRFDQVKLFNTRNAHQLLHYAKAHGLQSELKERLFRAYFTDGRALGDINVLVDVAREVGLDPSAAREVVETGRYLQAVLGDEARGRTLGVNGVPSFVVNDRQVASGAQSAEAFRKLLEASWRESTLVESER